MPKSVLSPGVKDSKAPYSEMETKQGGIFVVYQIEEREETGRKRGGRDGKEAGKERKRKGRRGEGKGGGDWRGAEREGERRKAF